jgi:type 1 fimbriae regulatory protein FimB
VTDTSCPTTARQGAVTFTDSAGDQAVSLNGAAAVAIASGRYCRRLSTTQPLRDDELRAIKAWLKERARMKPTGKTFFVSEQRRPLHRSTVNLFLKTYSLAASLPLVAHPHMLRHACGFALADQGADTRLFQDFLGHRNIQHTVKYTATNPARFEKLWR